MEITECIINEDGSRSVRTLYRYHVTSNDFVDGRVSITGNFEKVNEISPGLQKRLLENGMPAGILKELLKGGVAA